MTDTPALERLLRRDRVVTAAGLVLLWALAWAYILAGAGMGASAWDMTRLSLFPHLAAAPSPAAMAGMPDMPGMAGVPPPAWTAAFATLVVAMWWTMMVAMMAPSAAPAILLYGRVHRHAAGPSRERLAPSWAFAAGYLAMWLAFAAIAAAVQWALQAKGLLGPDTMASRSRWLSAAVLAAAGLYQLSPLQSACLSHC